MKKLIVLAMASFFAFAAYAQEHPVNQSQTMEQTVVDDYKVVSDEVKDDVIQSVVYTKN